MDENKVVTIKSTNREVKSRPNWKFQKRNLIIESRISKLKKSFRKILAMLFSTNKTAVTDKPDVIIKQVNQIVDEKPSWKDDKRKLIINHEVNKFTKAFRENFATLIISALGLVAALSWNDAIKTTIDTLFTTTGNLIYKFYVAVVVTIISVIITYFISKIKPKT